MERSLYVAHIITNASNIFLQKTCSICVNEFVEQQVGHFESGRFIPDELPTNYIYHRQYLLDGYAPPQIIIDLVMWMQQNDLWLPWMSNFDQIALVQSNVAET